MNSTYIFYAPARISSVVFTDTNTTKTSMPSTLRPSERVMVSVIVMVRVRVMVGLGYIYIYYRG